MSNHAPSLQPLDKQVEQVRHSIADIETDITKAAIKGQKERVTRLASLLSNQRATLAGLLDKLAQAPGFAPGTLYKAKAIDHASYHSQPKAKAKATGKARHVVPKGHELEELAKAQASTELQRTLGKPKGTKA
jgi:hypothetical protein